jgi:hypothetical protein
MQSTVLCQGIFMLKELADIIDAHGGLSYWRSLNSIEIELSASGFLFTSKRVTPLQHVRMTLSTTKPEVSIHDYPLPGQTTRSIGDERVEIVDEYGKILQERIHPCSAFSQLSRLFRWDTLDFAYFNGYAIWGYLTVPFLFMRDDVEVIIASDSVKAGYTKLVVKFPNTFPSHCSTQDFYFDQDLRLLRLDYTAEVVGSWAQAAHFCEEYKQFGGLSLPTRRRVYPKMIFRKPFKLITLVAIDIHDVIPHASKDVRIV